MAEQQTQQPEDSRCPPTYRREEAVKALIAMGWAWDGVKWTAQEKAEPVVMPYVYPPLPKPRAWGYLDNSGVEWAAYDTSQMEAYARAAFDAERAAKAAERVRVPNGWQPIETAPKSTADGTRVNGIYLLGFVPDPEEDFDRQALIDIIWWEPLLRNPRGGRGVWRRSAGGEDVDVEPTHWMHLPMAPEADHG